MRGGGGGAPKQRGALATRGKGGRGGPGSRRRGGKYAGRHGSIFVSVSLSLCFDVGGGGSCAGLARRTERVQAVLKKARKDPQNADFSSSSQSPRPRPLQRHALKTEESTCQKEE